MDLDLSRVRRPSRRFGWIDRRFLLEGHATSLEPVAVSLYLVLCVVADRHGVSWYGPRTLAGWTRCSAAQMTPALAQLRDAGLVAVGGRYVQVFDLDLLIPAPAPSRPTRVTRREQASESPPPKSAREQLDELSPDVLRTLLDRARAQLVRFTGGREPSRSVLEAVAAGLIRRGAA